MRRVEEKKKKTWPPVCLINKDSDEWMDKMTNRCEFLTSALFLSSAAGGVGGVAGGRQRRLQLAEQIFRRWLKSWLTRSSLTTSLPLLMLFTPQGLFLPAAAASLTPPNWGRKAFTEIISDCVTLAQQKTHTHTHTHTQQEWKLLSPHTC